MTAPSRMLDQRAMTALRRLEWRLRRRPVQTPLSGEYRSIFRGRGMEFDQVVKYEFGDDIRDVDWNVTAKLGDLYRKVFVEERELTVFVVVSDDPALQFGSGAAVKRDVLFELAALIMLLAVVNRERAGLLHVRPDGQTVYEPSRRRARILASVAGLFSAPAPDPAPERPFRSWPLITQPIPRGALVIWLGEVPAELPPVEWAAFRRRHPVVGVRVEDEWERSGPGAMGFNAYDPHSHEIVWMDGSRASRAAHAAWRSERERIWTAWFPDPMDSLIVDVAADPLATVVRFLRTRGRASAGQATGAP
jgi:uncharacterized protein (DUF58 family)